MAAKTLIFGGTGGVGAALARRIVGGGGEPFLAARREERLRALSRELGCGYAACDVLELGQIEAAVAAAAREDGLAGLAYCVGSIVLKPLQSAVPEDYLEAFRLNTVGAAEAVKFAAPSLRKANGAVVLFSTVAAQQGFSSHAVIAAAKGGVEALTKSLAAELAPKVRVNCIALSLTRTELAAPLTGNETMAKGLAQMHPLGRLGEADDAAALADFLLSPNAGWITGQVMHVDGGRGALRTKGS